MSIIRVKLVVPAVPAGIAIFVLETSASAAR